MSNHLGAQGTFKVKQYLVKAKTHLVAAELTLYLTPQSKSAR